MKRLLSIVIFTVFFLSFLSHVFHACSSDITYQPDYGSDDDFELYDSAETVKKHKRTWLDYFNNETYRMAYGVSSELEEAAYKDRDNFYVDKWQTDEEFWQKVYLDLYDKNKARLNFVQDSLKHIGDSLQLGHEDFARMVVSFVQDIPYNYILPDSTCAGHNDHPCVANVKYGILSPVEFLHSLSGDCDTRTVLLFTLLRNFGYDPVIINSNEYLHSMLALDIPVSGDYLEYKGKRYAFWETTNTGWLPGMLPPDMSNTSYWKVILDL